MKTKFHFVFFTKTVLQAILFFYIVFSVCPACATALTGNDHTEISASSNSTHGETLVVTSPCIPAAVFVTKNNCPTGQGFRHKSFINSANFLQFPKTLFNSSNRQHFHQGHFSLRLHLACSVLLI